MLICENKLQCVDVFFAVCRFFLWKSWTTCCPASPLAPSILNGFHGTRRRWETNVATHAEVFMELWCADMRMCSIIQLSHHDAERERFQWHKCLLSLSQVSCPAGCVVLQLSLQSFIIQSSSTCGLRVAASVVSGPSTGFTCELRINGSVCVMQEYTRMLNVREKWNVF